LIRGVGVFTEKEFFLIFFLDNNARGGGSKIIPLTQAQALEWAETYLDADDVEEHFSDLIEDA
jgi:hypothetical protein